jgi:protoporphyrinogen oxidase
VRLTIVPAIERRRRVAMRDPDTAVAILGAGISGLSTSYHLGHRGSVVFEAKDSYGGHVTSWARDGFTWDDGPHISFTANDYVRELFADNVDGEYEELDVRATNYYRGHWIEHPAQTHLYQVPEPLRSRCLASFLDSVPEDGHPEPSTYRQWLHQAMGPVFADTFPAAYTRKYWTTDPGNLDVDWIGIRVHRPTVEEVVDGAKGPLGRSTYYVASRDSRYPSHGGFWSYTHRLARGANIAYGKRLERVHFGRRRLGFSDGSEVGYEQLVSTIPLPVLIAAAEDAPTAVRDAALQLRCTNFLYVQVAANHPTKREEFWVYVYDEDKLSTRISFTERFSPNNAPAGTTGVQVEVYGSPYRPLPSDEREVGRRVTHELVEMGLVERDAVRSVHAKAVPWGNVIFDLDRRAALEVVDGFLDDVGVLRAGRYAEWKYLMTDACVLSGRRAASACAQAMRSPSTVS